MVKRGNVKFCPRCGTPNNIGDAYCIKCGYSFKRRKTSGSKTFLIVIILLIIAWIALRIFLKKPIIPTELIDLVKNMTSTKTG
jgi:predicted nucleic acid-binding Zn ribbon protein